MIILAVQISLFIEASNETPYASVQYDVQRSYFQFFKTQESKRIEKNESFIRETGQFKLHTYKCEKDDKRRKEFT